MQKILHHEEKWSSWFKSSGFYWLKSWFIQQNASTVNKLPRLLRPLRFRFCPSFFSKNLLKVKTGKPLENANPLFKDQHINIYTGCLSKGLVIFANPSSY